MVKVTVRPPQFYAVQALNPATVEAEIAAIPAEAYSRGYSVVSNVEVAVPDPVNRPDQGVLSWLWTFTDGDEYSVERSIEFDATQAAYWFVLRVDQGGGFVLLDPDTFEAAYETVVL